jgi:hypothetical protein
MSVLKNAHAQSKDPQVTPRPEALASSLSSEYWEDYWAQPSFAFLQLRRQNSSAKRTQADA